MRGRGLDRLLEQGQEELVLPAEVLVEAVQRLAGALDHFLNSELLARTGLEELGGGVEEPLHPDFGAHASRIERPCDRLLAPTLPVTIGGSSCQLALCHHGKAYPRISVQQRSPTAACRSDRE